MKYNSGKNNQAFQKYHKCKILLYVAKTLIYPPHYVCNGPNGATYYVTLDTRGLEQSLDHSFVL